MAMTDDEMTKARALLEPTGGPPFTAMIKLRAALSDALDLIADLQLKVTVAHARIVEEQDNRNYVATERDDLRAKLYAAESANRTLSEQLVSHVDLNGHIDISKQCCDYLNHEAMNDGDHGGKLRDFVTSISVVLEQFDKQRRSRNWYEASYTAGKTKLIEYATQALTAERDALKARVGELEAERDEARAEADKWRRGGFDGIDAIVSRLEVVEDERHQAEAERDTARAELEACRAECEIANGSLSDLGGVIAVLNRRMSADAKAHEVIAKERDAWRNCFICMECGRGAVDEDGCCATCGRDCLMFTDGKMINGTLIDNIEADIMNQTSEAIASYIDAIGWSIDGDDIRSGAWRKTRT